MTELTKLNDVYKNWITGDGVFTDLNTLDVPWKNENNVAGLNMAYHGSHSGDKNISPVVYKFLKNEDVNTRVKLATIIYTMFSDKWDKLWNALAVQYDPLSNYDMIEDETTNGTNGGTLTKTGTETTTFTGTDTNAKSGTDTVNRTGTDTNALSGKDTLKMTGTDTVTNTGTDNTVHTGSDENLISAFNSSSYEDSTKTTRGTADNTTKNLSNAETRNMTDETTYGKTETETRNMTDATHYGETNTETRNMTDTVTHNTTDTTAETSAQARHLTRSGNIGVTTSQQMLQSEIDLRKWLYYQSVFNDIDTILTLSIY